VNRTPEILAELRDEIHSAPSVDLPSIIGQISALHAEAFARLMQPTLSDAVAVPEEGDRLLTPAEVADRLGQTSRWVRDHQLELPRVKLPGRALRFSEKRLSALIKRRSYG
jgi:hypothetical protein